jgi:hypothetical protein
MFVSEDAIESENILRCLEGEGEGESIFLIVHTHEGMDTSCFYLKKTPSSLTWMKSLRFWIKPRPHNGMQQWLLQTLTFLPWPMKNPCPTSSVRKIEKNTAHKWSISHATHR